MKVYSLNPGGIKTSINESLGIDHFLIDSLDLPAWTMVRLAVRGTLEGLLLLDSHLPIDRIRRLSLRYDSIDTSPDSRTTEILSQDDTSRQPGTWMR